MFDSEKQRDGESLEDFHTRVLNDIVPGALDQRAAEITQAADAGQPPIKVLIPDLDHLICEGYYWRRVEHLIQKFLEPSFKTAGRKPTSIGVHPSGRCYKRVNPDNDSEP